MLWFHQLSKENGLSNTSAYAVFQDSEGFTWIGTESGLDRFDGRSVVQYLPDPADSTKLSGNLVNGGFFEDSAKNIWFCNEASIQCYERRHGRFRTFQVVYRGLPARPGYKAIYLERDSFLWVKAESRSFFRFNIHTHEASGPIAKTSFDINIFPGSRPDGRLRYLFSIDGAKSQGVELFELDGAGELIRSYKTFGGDGPEPALNIHRVFFEHDTAVWLSANTGIYKWNIFTGGYQAFSTGYLHAKSIAPYGKLHFIVAELKTGLYLFDKRNGEFKRLGCRLAGSPLSNINASIDEPYADPLGNIWLLNLGEGLIFSNPGKTKFGSLPKFEGINGALNYDFRTMAQGADRRIWCSTFNHGIFMLDERGNPLRHYHPDHPQFNSLDSRQVNHLMLDNVQRLWVATAKGVSYFDPASGSFEPVRDEKGEKVAYIVYLHQLKNGDILAASLLHGIFKIEKGKTGWVLKQILPPASEQDFFTSIYEDKLGYIYVPHGFSEILIFTYSKGKLEHRRATLGINGLINGFYEDKDDKTLWIATSAGLLKKDKTDLKKPHRLFTTKDGLQSNEIQSLAPGLDGNLWMGAATGISMFDPDSSKFVNFGLPEGAQSRQFNALSVLNHADGSIWFGGDNGITIVEPEKIGFLQTKPRLQFTEIKINDEVHPGLADAASGNTNVHTIKELKLGFRENTISLSFVAIDYSGQASTQLEFMMERVDDGWVRLQKGEPGFARYPNLPPGKYAFKIRAANSDGVWADEVKELSITITPPWYQRWWARALFVLLGALLLYAAYRFRVNQIRKAEAFRRKEAEYKQLVAENETAVLRLQMNPHFIFNSMNSISSYILHKDIDTANGYLNRFARLMRLILKFSEKPFISISQELELLELYLNTEAMRFEDKIDYEFKVDGLDPDEVIIPTMILQPFIENAIWHGLAGKEGPKKITVSFGLKDGQLNCSVADNGVGRAAAGQRKPLSSTHDSKAIDITTRRLRILEETEGAATALSITDLADEAGLPAGTLVEIRLPVL